MKHIAKRLLISVIALCALALMFVMPSNDNQAHASMFYHTYYHNTWTPRVRHTRWFDGVHMKRGHKYENKAHVYISRKYAYMYDKPFDQGSFSIKAHLHYKGHHTWKFNGGGMSGTIHYVNKREIKVYGFDMVHTFYR